MRTPVLQTTPSCTVESRRLRDKVACLRPQLSEDLSHWHSLLLTAKLGLSDPNTVMPLTQCRRNSVVLCIPEARGLQVKLCAASPEPLGKFLEHMNCSVNMFLG